MQQYKILWADDEIDLLKPHILFLEEKGYQVTPVNSGVDALDELQEQYFDIVFLDENMPGISGLETLDQIKSKNANIPVVMITKSEEEHIMEEAIGAKIADYLIKPINPNQILLSVKKLLDNKRLISEKTNTGYQQQFATLGFELQECQTYEEWSEVYKKLVYWEMQIDQTADKSMLEVLKMQKTEANRLFSDFVKDDYHSWLDGEGPLLSHRIMKEKVFPEASTQPIFLIVIDNLRWDQWEIIEPEIADLFEVTSKESYFSILPTTTEYARNAMFAGLLPEEIRKNHPQFWVDDEEEGSRNKYEKELLGTNVQKEGLDLKHSYHKIITAKDGKQFVKAIDQILSNDLNVAVYNFVDMMSHARTDMHMIRELAPDESAYRQLTRTWFSHSSLKDALQKLAERGAKVMITTDHGTIKVKNPVRIIGDKNTNTNLRFKTGKNLGYDDKDLFEMQKPEDYFLPKQHLSSTYVFASDDAFFAYPNNYNHYAKYYADTFQHGGISMEEMIIPLISLKPKS